MPTFIIFENATIKAKKFAKICEQIEMPTFRVQSKKINSEGGAKRIKA